MVPSFPGSIPGAPARHRVNRARQASTQRGRRVRIIVTGAAGATGRFLVPWLQRLGHEITPISLRDSAQAFSRLPSLLGGTGALVHLAAFNPDQMKGAGNPASFDAVNHRLTGRLAHLVCDQSDARMVFISSARVYGIPQSPGPLLESAPLLATDAYGLSKIKAETALLDVFSMQGRRLVILRPPVIIGTAKRGVPGLMASWGESGLPLPALFDKAEKSVLPVDDFCHAIALSLPQDAPSGIFNVAGNSTVSLGPMADIFSRAKRGRPLPRLPLAGLQSRALRLMPGVIRHALTPLVLDCAAFSGQFGWQPEGQVSEVLLAAHGRRTMPA